MNDRKTKWLKVPYIKTKLNQMIEMKQASQALTSGKVVAFPTETVYGLGADATSDKAVQAIFEAKGRPQDNPLIVHVGRKEQLFEIGQDIPSVARKLIDTFWPGPLTLVVLHKDKVSRAVTVGHKTVGVRMPDHPVALSLLQLANIPIAAPSANLSGRPSPTEAKHVWEDLRGRIDILLDGGKTGVGVESTILDITKEVPVILRPGGVIKEQIESVIKEVVVDSSLQCEGSTPLAPGMKYTHYAPNGEMWLVEGNEERVISYIQEQIKTLHKDKKVGVLTTEENKDHYKGAIILPCGRRAEPHSIAKKLYTTLRAFDANRVDVIYSETFPDYGLFFSIMNRLRKAAGNKVVKV